MNTAISYRALTTIFFQATDRTVFGLPGSAAEGTAEQTLSYIADKIDMHIESAIRNANRTTRDAADFLSRGCRPWSSSPLSSAEELAADSAKIEALVDVYEGLLPALLRESTGTENLRVGARSLAALIVDQLGDAVPALEDQAWQARREDFGRAAVSIVRLGIAFSREAAEAEVIAKAAEIARREAAALAEVEAKNAAKAAEKARRAADRKAAKSVTS